MSESRRVVVVPAVRIRLVRWGLWALVGVAVVAGVTSWVSDGNPPPVASNAVTVPEVPPGAVGVAERSAVRWLADAGASLEVVDVSLVASSPQGDGWALTVAVDVVEVVDDEREGSVWWVAVVVDDSGYLAGGPGLVPPPALAGDLDAPAGLAAPRDDDPVAGTVSGVLGALLAGEGTPDPYLATPEVLGPSEPSFASVSLDRIASADDPDGSLRVWAQVEALTPGGARLDVFYELVLVRSGDRWLVESLSAPAGWGAELDLVEPLPEKPARAVSFSSAPGA